MTGRAHPTGQIGLTEREVQTVGLAAEGLKINAIARRLSVSAGAVQSRLKFARLKTGSARTTALVHAAYASGQLSRPAPEPPVSLTDEQVRVLGYLADGLTVVDMQAQVGWTQWRLRETYGDLLAALDAADRPAYAIKRGWAMGHLSADKQTN
ncbi:hypothetical protein OTB20_25525 [Streptomyces sp. H27-H1]|uniref:hypothetical protein n=1 Tax=Streptomyces sp. H27-H1 TaxID=2996461 RepID=UPI00226E9A9A|nr:hypothetical protein [Streptomyces sp. H27-H1]MCY0929500.1 hypothetical protein [Streptomyces sp. H27-H1]